MFALGIIVLLGMIGTVIAVTSTDNSVANEKPDEVVEVTEPTEVEEPTETEIAIKENNDAVKDDNAVANVDLEPDETEPIEPIEVEPEIVEEPEEKPVKKKVTKKIRKKTTPKEKTVETVSEKPKEKPVEKKTTKKKDGPKKFSIPVKKFDAK